MTRSGRIDIIGSTWNIAIGKDYYQTGIFFILVIPHDILIDIQTCPGEILSMLRYYKKNIILESRVVDLHRTSEMLHQRHKI